MKIVLIGAGNVSFHLGKLLKSKRHKVLQIYNRSQKDGKLLAKELGASFTSDIQKINVNADVYIVALKDDSIESFIKKLKFIPKLIVHTSGSIGLDIFPDQFKNAGVLYPLQTFSKAIKRTPKKIPICIEAKNKSALITIKKLANSISIDIYELNSKDREFAHLAAVFVNNFTNHLFVIAEEILKTRNIPFDILKPLISETAEKIQSGSPEQMQTGPAARKDSIILKKHMKMLNKFPLQKNIYNRMSKSIQNKLKK